MLPLWYSILGAFVSIITTAGNGIVIYVIAKRRRLHNPTNWIVLSLAIADLLIGSGCVLTDYLFEKFPFKHRLRYVVLSFLSGASVTNLCLLTLDRYIFITKPLRYVTLVTTKRTFLLIFTAWMASFLPHFVFYLISSEDRNDVHQRNFVIFDSVVFEIIPIIILSFASGHILYIIRKRSSETAMQMEQLRSNRGTENTEEPSQNQRNSSIKVIGVAVTAFIICYINEACHTILFELTEEKEHKDYEFASVLLLVGNSAINPVAYALFKSDIKKSVKSMFCCSGENS